MRVHVCVRGHGRAHVRVCVNQLQVLEHNEVLNFVTVHGSVNLAYDVIRITQRPDNAQHCFNSYATHALQSVQFPDRLMEDITTGNFQKSSSHSTGACVSG